MRSSWPPVQMPGGWVYVDRAGHTVTEGFYDPTYATGTRLYSDTPAAEPFYAAPLQNGYAAVRRGGAWGLLDAAGTEVIPCEQAGVAWEGTTLWLKEKRRLAAGGAAALSSVWGFCPCQVVKT